MTVAPATVVAGATPVSAAPAASSLKPRSFAAQVGCSPPARTVSPVVATAPLNVTGRTPDAAAAPTRCASAAALSPGRSRTAPTPAPPPGPWPRWGRATPAPPPPGGRTGWPRANTHGAIWTRLLMLCHCGTSGERYAAEHRQAAGRDEHRRARTSRAGSHPIPRNSPAKGALLSSTYALGTARSGRPYAGSRPESNSSSHGPPGDESGHRDEVGQ